MIKISNIISKPVVSISNGKIEGVVKKAVFDKNFKRLKYLILFDNNEELEERCLFVKNIFSLGDNAIVVKDSLDLSLELSYQNITDKPCPINNDVYTYLGKFVGKINDINIDENYNIAYLSVGQTELALNSIIECGENVVIVQDEEKKVKLSSLKKKRSNIVKIEMLKTKEDQKVYTLNSPEPKLLEHEILQENSPLEETKTKSKYDISKSPTQPIMITTNYEFLIGRKIERNIYSQNRELIAKKNSKITTNTINLARMFGKTRELIKFSK